MNKEKLIKYQERILRALAGRIDDFYLSGGTALSLFYFQHRLSVDLDFFSPDFSRQRIEAIAAYLRESLKKEIKLIGQSLEKDKARFLIYNIYFSKKDIMKIDFVEDIFKLIKSPKVVNDINILSLEDIYIRKLYAFVGTIPSRDIIGRKEFTGGRVEAKDFLDIYFLSRTFMPMAKFADKYADANMKEALINWFRRYDRMQVMAGILDLPTDKNIDYRKIENHFRKEIDKIIEGYIGEL